MMSIFRSLFVIVAVAAVAGGATYSQFSDTSVAGENTFATGTLDLKTNDADGVSKQYTISGLKPGSWDLAGQVVLKNAGTINGHAWLEIVNVKNLENGCLSPEVGDTSCGTGTDQGELGDIIRASFQQNIAPWTRYGGNASINTEKNIKIDLFDINAGDSVPLVLYAAWHPSYSTTEQDNKAQGDSTTFDVIFHLDQK